VAKDKYRAIGAEESETMDSEETIMFEKIASYLASQMDISAEDITRDTTFESLGIDSLDMVEMVMDLEEELGVELEMEEKLATVGELVDFVESKMG
jgi:acyl carrier protein